MLDFATAEDARHISDMRSGSRILLDAIALAYPARVPLAANDVEPPKVEEDKPEAIEPVVTKFRPLWPSWYEPPAPRSPWAPLIDSVASFFGIMPKAITGAAKRGRPVAARSVVIRILRDRGYSYPEIARAVGRKDHKTMIYYVEGFDARARNEPEIADCYEAHRAAGWCK